MTRHKRVPYPAVMILVGVVLLLNAIGILAVNHAAPPGSGVAAREVFVALVGVCTGFVLGSLSRLL